MAKFAEAIKRLQENIFVCKRCKTKRRVPVMKVLQGKASCRNCKGKALRPARKK